MVSDKHLDLFVQTAYINKKKSLATPTPEQAGVNTPEANNGTAHTDSILPSSKKVNNKNSVKDSEGKMLTDSNAAETIAKLRAADAKLADTTDYINERLKHPIKDNIIDFARGKILFDVSGRKYSAEFVVGFTKSGICELHDIVNINTTAFEYKKRATSKGMDSKESTRSDVTLTDSILPSSEKVNKENGKFSLP